MTPKRLLIFFLGLLTILRLFYIAQIELSPDETYYLLWAKHLDWSYYSKGPGVAFVIRLGTTLFGDTAFGVRFFSPIFSLGTSLLLFFFARRLYNESVAIWAVLLLNATPIFNIGSLLMTIDPISVFFWMAAIYTFWLALERAPKFSGWWLATGVCIGLGFLAKFTNAMQLISIVLVLLCVRKYRSEFKRPGLWLLLATFLIFTIPPIYWNANHAWITVSNLSERGGLDSSFALHPSAFLQFFGTHFAVYSPLLFAGTLIALWQGSRLARIHYKPRFLILQAAPILVMYSCLALKKPGEPNWTALAFISLAIWTAAFWHKHSLTAKWKGRLCAASLVLGIVMTLLVLNTDFIASILTYNRSPTTRLLGWQTTADQVQKVRDQFEHATGKPAFLIANKYQTASELSFYLPKKRVHGPGWPPVFMPESQAIQNEFSFWPRYDEFEIPANGKPTADSYDRENPGVNHFMGHNALYITDDENDGLPTSIKRGFRRTELIALFQVQRYHLPLRTIRIFACYNYRTISL